MQDVSDALGASSRVEEVLTSDVMWLGVNQQYIENGLNAEFCKENTVKEVLQERQDGHVSESRFDNLNPRLDGGILLRTRTREWYCMTITSPPSRETFHKEEMHDRNGKSLYFRFTHR